MAAGKWLPPAELTDSGRPVLLSGELERSTLSSVDLVCEENPNFPHLKTGILILTTHRILWIDETKKEGAASIPLGAVTHIFSLKKSIKTMFGKPKVRFQVSTLADGRIDEKGSTSMVIMLILRGKSDPESFYNRFWEVWKSKSWEVVNVSGSSESRLEGSGGSIEGSSVVRMPVVGISGILRKEQETWENTDKSLHDAFQDLSALMSKAKEMVMLAEKMRLKLLSGSNSQANAANDEEIGSKQDMQDWLLSVGIVSPVTKDSAGAQYHQQLSRQLADFVKIPLERGGGMIAVVDVYCLFNRARGTELISPEDLLQACALWEKIDVSVILRKFESGVMVIQNKSHSDEEVFARIKSLALKPSALWTGISPSDAAITLGIAPALAKEHLLNAESQGLLCRDISPEGFRFFINVFKDIDPNNMHSVKEHGIYSTWTSAIPASG